MEKEQKRLKKEKALKKAAEEAAAAAAGDGESMSSDRDLASNVSPSITGDDDGDETEDEGGESAVKRLKVGD